MNESEERSVVSEVEQHAFDVRRAALNLYRLMRELSEGHWHAGWIIGLEDRLWDVATGVRHLPGEYTAPSRLRRLARDCGCWWVGGGLDAPRLVPLAEWEQMRAEYRGRPGGRLFGAFPADQGAAIDLAQGPAPTPGDIAGANAFVGRWAWGPDSPIERLATIVAYAVARERARVMAVIADMAARGPSETEPKP